MNVARKNITRSVIPIVLSIIWITLVSRFALPHWVNPLSALPPDLNTYLSAGQRLIDSQPLYIDADAPYKYPPIFAYAMKVFLTHSTWPTIAFFWQMASITLFIFALEQLARKFDLQASFKGGLLFFASALLTWNGTIEILAYGQIDLMIFSLLVFAALSPRFELFVFGFCLALKPQLMPIAIFCAMTKPRPFVRLATLTGTTLCWLVLPMLWLPISQWGQLAQWVDQLNRSSPNHFLVNAINVSAAAYLSRTVQNEVLMVPLTALFFVSFVALPACHFAFKTTVNTRIKTEAETENSFFTFSLGIAATLLVSPLSWRWQVIYWIPCLFTIFGEFKPRGVTQLLRPGFDDSWLETGLLTAFLTTAVLSQLGHGSAWLSISNRYPSLVCSPFWPNLFLFILILKLALKQRVRHSRQVLLKSRADRPSVQEGHLPEPTCLAHQEQ